jgi:hypothetical protein
MSGDKEKDLAAAMKEKGVVMPTDSKDQCSIGVEEGEVFMTVDDGFGMELEELLLVLAYIVEKSRGGIMYHAGSRRPTRTRVYSTRGTCMVASNPPISWSGRSSTKKLIVWMSAVATCAHSHGSWSLV